MDKIEEKMIKRGFVKFGDGYLPKKEAEKFKVEKTLTRLRGKSQTQRVRKIQPKKQKLTKTVEQKTHELEKRKKAALLRFLGWTPKKQQTTLDTFEESVRDGKSNRYIATELGFKDVNYLRWWAEEQYSKKDRFVSLRDIKQSIISKAGTPTEKWSEFRNEEGTFEQRMKRKFCPIVSTGNRSVYSRKYPLVAEGDEFCEESKIIPDLSVQPIKRIRIAAHSYITSEAWKDGEKLKDLSVRICTMDKDKFRTIEGGIIISKSLHDREGLDKGDKLLGLHGLKGIVCEVRDMENDLLINKAQVWGKKSSAKNGGAILEMQNSDKLSCFYQKAHTIRETIFKDIEGKEYARGTFSSNARFSPDLVPFLYTHLGFKVLQSITQKNRGRVNDFLRFLNAEFHVKDAQVFFKPLRATPTLHKGGMLVNFDGYFYCKREWKEPLDKTAIILYNNPCYPFYPKKLWLPDWFDGEGLLEYEDKDGIAHKTALAKFIEGERLIRGDVGTRPLIKQLYRTVYGRIENSIGYLIAVPIEGSEKTLILNSADCGERDIEEDEEVLVWRPPVVSVRLPNTEYSEKTKHSNILKLKVKFGAKQKTAEINVATMRLMFGDFDGDALYVMKIPKGTANDLRPGIELTKEIEAVQNEIKELDAIKIPVSKRDILLSMRTAFIAEEHKKGYLTELEAKLGTQALNRTPTNKLRNNAVLLHEAEINHNEAIVESRKITEIGGLTKWGWMAATQDEIEGLVTATQSIEIMKDRPKSDNEGYLEDKKYLMALKQRLSEGDLKTGYRIFVKFCSHSAYTQGIVPRRKAPTYGQFCNKALTPAESVIGKWVSLLTLPEK